MVDIVHHLSDLHQWETPFGVVDLSSFHWEVAGVDLTPTKPVIMMWIAGLIVFLSLTISFRGGRLLRNTFAHILEVYILYIRDEVVYSILGEKEGRRMLPFFLTVFFFILGMNLLGLVPYGATATANVNVTGGLALIAFLVIQGMGIAKLGLKGYLRSIVPPGLPVFVIPIMVPVEIVGMLAKPFALCIRLFANMVAGHAVILALLGLIFLSRNLLLAPLPVLGAVAISLLEIFVAHLQAFIFTILTCLFVQMSMHPAH